MKAQYVFILAALIGSGSPAYAQDVGQDVVQGQERYETSGNFAWATKFFTLHGTGGKLIPIEITVKCPKNYVALSEGHIATLTSSGQTYDTQVGIWETQPTKNHNGWVFGTWNGGGSAGDTVNGAIIVTCALSSAALYRR